MSLSFISLPPISIHAPLAGSDDDVTDFKYALVISIHAPLAGSDCQTKKH